MHALRIIWKRTRIRPPDIVPLGVLVRRNIPNIAWGLVTRDSDRWHDMIVHSARVIIHYRQQRFVPPPACADCFVDILRQPFPAGHIVARVCAQSV